MQITEQPLKKPSTTQYVKQNLSSIHPKNKTLRMAILFLAHVAL